jgi:hypothetical protein
MGKGFCAPIFGWEIASWITAAPGLASTGVLLRRARRLCSNVMVRDFEIGVRRGRGET